MTSHYFDPPFPSERIFSEHTWRKSRALAAFDTWRASEPGMLLLPIHELVTLFVELYGHLVEGLSPEELARLFAEELAR